VEISKEKEANEAIKNAVQALIKARELAERAEYGSLLLEVLADAHKSAHYAFDMVRDRI